MEKIITLNNICKSYSKRIILDKLSLNIYQQDFIAILGLSGAGKSTLFNIIAGFELPDAGSVDFTSNDQKKNIGFVFQSFNLISRKTVKDNILLPLQYNLTVPDIESYYESLLERMNIKHIENEMVDNLSGGERQRVAIARAMITKPKILLADEPTGNLDEENGIEVMKILKDLNLMGTSIILITHSKEISMYANQRFVLIDGKLSRID